MTWNRLSDYKTTISAIGGMNTVIYHETQIVRWDQYRIILNSGGWETATTKKKMNQASYQFNLGYSVYQEDFIWHVSIDGIDYDFRDGMIILRDPKEKKRVIYPLMAN
jgi:hypothetical protein